MNRRFLAPEINPLNSIDNEFNRENPRQNSEMKKNSKIYGNSLF